MESIRYTSNPVYGSNGDIIGFSNMVFITSFDFQTNSSTDDNQHQSQSEDNIKAVQISSPITCSITLDEVTTECYELPCGHQFSDAIHEWVKNKNTCPVCRIRVNKTTPQTDSLQQMVEQLFDRFNWWQE